MLVSGGAIPDAWTAQGLGTVPSPLPSALLLPGQAFKMNSAEELWTPLAPLPSTNMGIQRPRSCGPGSYCEWPLEVEKNFTPAGFRPRLRRHARIAGQSAFCNKKRPAPQPEIRGNYYLSLGK